MCPSTNHSAEVSRMAKAPTWFISLAVVALLWNLAGIVGVASDLLLSAADIKALPPSQQAIYYAQPVWFAFASVLAVVAGTLGCVAFLLRKRWALIIFYVSLVGIVAQDIAFIIVARAAGPLGTFPVVLQSCVLIIGIALVVLARIAVRRAWLTSRVD